LRLDARRCWFLGAALLFGVSLLLPAVQGRGFPSQTGLDLLRQAASGISDGVVGWYANPALWLALVLGWFGWRRSALVFAVLGLLLALSSFSAGVVAASAGRSVPDFTFAAGFYVWLGAFVAALVGAGLPRD
jgi:hypothetical protein